MLRPTPSKIIITAEDIQDLKTRLANRANNQDFINGISNTDWCTTDNSNSSQNRRPQQWRKGLLRPGPDRSVDDAFVIYDNQHSHDEPSGLATTRLSREIFEATEVHMHGYPHHENLTSTATDLALARQIIDEAANNATDHRVDPRSPEVRQRIHEAVRAPTLAPPTAPIYRDSNSSHIGLSYDETGSSDSVPGNSKQYRAPVSSHSHLRSPPQGQTLDGSNDRVPVVLREGDNRDTFSHSIFVHPSLRDQHRFRYSLMPGDESQDLTARSLDPQAPTFVPTTRFGSADDEDIGRSSAQSHNHEHNLRPRPSSWANSDNHQTGTSAPGVAGRDHVRAQIQGRNIAQRGRRVNGTGPQNRGGDHIAAPFLSPRSDMGDRQPVTEHSSLTPSGVQPHVSNRPLPQTHEISDSMLPARPRHPRHPHMRRNVDQRSQMSHDSLRQHSTAQSTANGSYSVPNLVSSTSSQTPVIHSRQSSLAWNRNTSTGVATASSHISSAMTLANGLGEQVEVHSAQYFARNTAPTQTFYLNNSPLDELTDGLRRFSDASSVRLSSVGSSSLRPFRAKLLSGSLFYSEEIYPEDHQSASESEQQDSGITSTGDTGIELHLPPLIESNFRPFPRSLSPASGTSRSLSPQSVSSLPRSLQPGWPVAEGSPTPSTPLAQISPVTSGPTYSLPVSSMPQIELSPSSPPQDMPSDPPVPSPGVCSPSTPSGRRAHRLSDRIYCTEPRPRAAAVPKFKIYDDGLPAAIQPQTPADLGRRHLPAASVPYKTASDDYRGLSPSPVSNNQRDTYLATQLRPIFEPSTAELTMIPFMSPSATRQSRAPARKRRSNKSIMEEQENAIDISALAELEGERRAWLRRSTGSDMSINLRDSRSQEVLQETPPQLGRFERLARD